MNLADVEEPRLLAIEYGDEVVRREAMPSSQVASKLVAKPTAPTPSSDAVTTSIIEPQDFH
ncbi:hypothetical protein, partial [Salmonella sp. SAL4444]|uniref:hypothetical protein n=1 Tax=Salmonella sp. SAL4444 TaxID=3159899 RepID=UPI00397C3FFA